MYAAADSHLANPHCLSRDGFCVLARSDRHFSSKLGASLSLAPQISPYTTSSQGFTLPEVIAQYGGMGMSTLRHHAARSHITQRVIKARLGLRKIKLFMQCLDFHLPQKMTSIEFCRAHEFCRSMEKIFDMAKNKKNFTLLHQK